ncbi:MAG: hypothetical protein ACJA0T_002320 [Colwellia sp.]|jgi:hypothetical protein
MRFQQVEKGSTVQVIRSKHNLSTYIRVGKALIEENSNSIVEINNAGDDNLSACP